MVLQHQEQMEEVMMEGKVDEVEKKKKEYKLAVDRQKGAMKNLKHLQGTMESVMQQQQSLQKALSVQKQMQDVAKAQRAKGMAKAQVDIQEKQVEVMKQAAALQAAVPDTPEGRDMSAAEAQRGYQGVDTKFSGLGVGAPSATVAAPGTAWPKAWTASSTASSTTTKSENSLPSTITKPCDRGDVEDIDTTPLMTSRGTASMFEKEKERQGGRLDMPEEWEIDFSEIEFSPNGVPSSENRIGHGGFGEVFLGQLGGMPVAVKKLYNQEHAERGMKEFRAEVGWCPGESNVFSFFNPQ